MSYVNYRFIIIIIFILLTCTHTYSAQSILTQRTINEKVTDILSSGADENDTPLHERRDVKLFQFRKFIDTAKNSVKSDQPHVIWELRTLLNEKRLEAYIRYDLGESVEFILKRLMRAEQDYQDDNDNTVIHDTEFPRFVGYISVNGSSLTGTLLPLPKQEGGFSWYVLTSAHLLNGIGIIDRVEDKVTFTTSMGLSIPIKSIKIFREGGKNVSITNIKREGDETFNVNSINFADVRASPRFGNLADVALCEIENNPTWDPILTHVLNVKSVEWHNMALLIKRECKGEEQIIAFNFVNTIASAHTQFERFNREGKSTKFILGYANLSPTNDLRISQPREAYTALYDRDTFGEFVSQYHFVHDVPTFWGMSGGPVVHVHNQNRIDVFGVVKSGTNMYDPHDSSKRSLCSASFLQKVLTE